MNNKTQIRSVAGAVAGGLLFVLVIVFFCVADNRQDTLATDINGYIGHTLPTLSLMPDLPANVAVGNNAVWWIGEGVEFAGGGNTKSNGIMRSSWGGGTFALAPRFEELDSIFIVKGRLVEEKEYLRVPAGMSPTPDFVYNPFKSKDAAPSSFTDRYGNTHNADEFKQTLKTYGLQVWILDVKSNRIVGYREFPAALLQDNYDENHTADEVHLSALVQWIESLQKLKKKP